MADLTFYTHPMSRSRVVRWMLEEVRASYDLHVVDFGAEMKSPEYLAINPMGKVPAVKAGNVVVTEVIAICAWLADRYPIAKLAPEPGSLAMGPYLRWLFFMAGPFEQATTAQAFGWELDDEKASMAGCGHVKDVFDTLEKALQQGPYLCGDSFTTADLIVSSYLGWQMTQSKVEARPGFEDYVSRMTQRPAARRADELDNALAEKVA